MGNVFISFLGSELCLGQNKIIYKGQKMERKENPVCFCLGVNWFCGRPSQNEGGFLCAVSMA